MLFLQYFADPNGSDCNKSPTPPTQLRPVFCGISQNYPPPYGLIRGKTN
ncbi:hypothetical protein CORMATOL_01623 [Corynebacterium matruchotii ATCC 33806]|uniref:Uncharacterized protein n=1 Tax=Corynebacterium matruchotii ATCC 33806 TaxID=566549 RepID=C0E3Q7_9CORY|nr:hypothetical protein CORMATOL_01623 [Corynebacterium matruchotii ATCC 33806]